MNDVLKEWRELNEKIMRVASCAPALLWIHHPESNNMGPTGVETYPRVNIQRSPDQEPWVDEDLVSDLVSFLESTPSK